MVGSVEHCRPVALVTGAAGGIGRACSRRLATRYALALNEFRAEALHAYAELLHAEEGIDGIIEMPGDLSDPLVMGSIVELVSGPLRAIIHTAGLSSQTSDWQSILDTNLLATARLLNSVEPVLQSGTVAVLISSISRLQVGEPSPEILEVLEHPLESRFLESMEPLLGEDEMARRSAAYCWSKWWVHREVQRRANRWAEAGARIMSVSPGMIWTSMGRMAAEKGKASVLVEATPMQRWGRPADIAGAVEFILSDQASFMTGSDLLVDGGIGARMQSGQMPIG